MNIIEKTAYVCQVCGKWFSDKAYAEKCCTSKECEMCDKILPCNYYYTCCDTCREQKKFEKAQKISLKEYYEKFPNYPLFTSDGDYIQDFEDWAEWHEDEEIPEYLYGATEQFAELCAESIINNLNEEVVFEDDIEMFSENELKEIYEFCEQWNKKYKFRYFEENSKIAVYTKEKQEDEM